MRSFWHVMRAACVVQALPVMHAFGAWAERIASLITAQLHHLSLDCVLRILHPACYNIPEVIAMSHSKLTRRGRSLYLEKWNPSAKKYICSCALCGKRGYSPAILEPDFVSAPGKLQDLERYAIREELIKTLCALPLDAQGRCEDCAAKLQRRI